MILLVDQKDSAGDTVKFFDISAKTQTGFLKIARKYNLKLIPIKNTRYNTNNFSISFYPPIKPFEKDVPDTKAMLSIHKIIEKWILENPSQWFWQHNRLINFFYINANCFIIKFNCNRVSFFYLFRIFYYFF